MLQISSLKLPIIIVGKEEFILLKMCSSTLIRGCNGTLGALYSNTNCTLYCNKVVASTSIPFLLIMKELLWDIYCDTDNKTSL